MARRSRELQSAREAADEARKAVKKTLPPPGAESTPETAARQAEYVLSEEIHKTRVAAMKKEEESVRHERELLEREKQAHIRALKRARDEDASRFNQHPLLGNRYVLMNMLGRGGFSEVYKAFDVVEMREVACKLHQLSPQWSEARKQTYVRHAQRECMIHKRLRHANVVEMIDVFEVDRDSFCTVLELCTGDDLDARLKAQGPNAEREARAVLAQIFAGLAYLSEGPKIIHYDLKPGNILFDAAGRVKITDFGLSKVDERGVTARSRMSRRARRRGLMGDSSMGYVEGAGKYWYLPRSVARRGPARRASQQGGHVVVRRDSVPDAVRAAAVRARPVAGTDPAQWHHPQRARRGVSGGRSQGERRGKAFGISGACRGSNRTGRMSPSGRRRT